MPLAAAAIACVWWLPPAAFRVAVGFVVALAAWEWSTIALIHDRKWRCLFVAAVIGSGAGLAAALPETHAPRYLMGVSAAFWVGALAMVIGTQKRRFSLARWPRSRAACGVFVLVPAWLGISDLRSWHGGAADVLFLLLLVWSADIAAYYAGKSWGRHRLCDVVSPGKSWEGAAAGVLAGTVLAFAYSASGNGRLQAMVIFVAVAAVTVMASIIGDLFESMVKRSADLKDSGTLLPGHGGVLDRIDSLTAAVPIFLLGLPLAGRGP